MENYQKDLKVIPVFCFKNPIEILNSREPDFLVVFDDVINTGAQFRAYSDFILENIQNPPRIIDRLWVKAIEKEFPSNEEVLDF